LFADFALEADVRLDDKGDAGEAEAVGEGVPFVHGEDYAEVRDGNVVSVNGVVVGLRGCGGLEVGYDLVAEEIEVNPLGGTAALRAAEGVGIEAACGFEVVYRKSKMERAKCGHTVVSRHR
jgi:hypothetical protein